MRALIVTGDDFGLSTMVNEAIILAHREGILTSASLMVTGKAFEHAVGLARANLGLSVGLHVVLVCGKSVLPQERIPDLVDSGGNFPQSPLLAGLRYFFSPRLIRQIREELKAQMERFLSTGLKLAFISGHLHMHLHPRVLPILLELAKGLGIRNFRLPRDGLFINLRYDRGKAMTKLFDSLVFKLLCGYCKRVLRKEGFLFPDRVYGLLQSGDMNTGYVSHLISNLPDGINEAYFHPSLMPCEEFSSWTPNYHPMEEFTALTDERIKGLLKARSIKLVDYSILGRG